MSDRFTLYRSRQDQREAEEQLARMRELKKRQKQEMVAVPNPTTGETTYVPKSSIPKQDASSSKPAATSDFKQTNQTGKPTTGNKTQASIAAAQALQQQMGSGQGQSQTTDTGMGAAEAGIAGATSGAVIGGMATSWTGPGAIIGASIGAVVGGTMGALKAKSARKAAQRKARAEAEATYRDSLANIELDKAAKINAALENMQVGFQNSLLRKLNVRL